MKRINQQKRIWLAAVSTALAIFLTGCGDSTGESSTSDTQIVETTTTSATLTEDTAVTTPAETTQPSTGVPTEVQPKIALSEMTDARYASISNESFSWWYRRPDPVNQDLPATIDPPVANMLKEYGGYWQAEPKNKTVYITSDEGYEVGNNTSHMLDVAKEKDFTLHFFLTGGYVKDHPDLVKRMLDEGHIVANHSLMHLNAHKVLEEKGVKAYVDEINMANEAMIEITGRGFAPYFRPPEGVYTERSLTIIRDMGYHPVFWSFAYKDWIQDAQPEHGAAKEQILGELHDGSILLLHANSTTNAEILSDLVDGIRARGYTIGNMNDLLAEDLAKAEQAENEVGAESETTPNSENGVTESTMQTGASNVPAPAVSKAPVNLKAKRTEGFTLKPRPTAVPAGPITPETASTTATPR